MSIWLTLAWSSSALGQSDSKSNKVILSEDPWPPYIMGVAGHPPSGGIAVDILQRVFDNLGVTLEMNLYPWARSLEMVKQGREDGHMLLVRSLEWDQYMTYSVPLVDDRFLLWTRKEDGSPIQWQQFSDLKPYKIAITENYSYGREFTQAVDEHQLTIFDAVSDELNFKLLLGKRFDAFICLESVANTIFASNPNFKAQFVASAKPIAELPLIMALAKNSPAVALLPKINQQIMQMKASGEISRIIGKYQMTDDSQR